MSEKTKARVVNVWPDAVSGRDHTGGDHSGLLDDELFSTPLALDRPAVGVLPQHVVPFSRVAGSHTFEILSTGNAFVSFFQHSQRHIPNILLKMYKINSDVGVERESRTGL
jgi:hypothetical protein